MGKSKHKKGNSKNAGKWMGTISIHVATECKAGIPKAKRGAFIILVVLLQALLAD